MTHPPRPLHRTSTIRDLAVTASLYGFATLPGDWHSLTEAAKTRAASAILKRLAEECERSKAARESEDLRDIVGKFLAATREAIRPASRKVARGPRNPGRIRVSFLLPVFQCGGVESWTISLCREFRAAPQLGIDVVGVGLILGEGDDSQPNPATLAELQQFAPVITSGRHGSTTMAARDGREVVRMLGVNSDALVAWSLPQLGWLLGGLGGESADGDERPFVVGVSHGCANWWMREAADSVDHWAAVSRAALPPIPKAARDAGRVSVVLNGIDLERIGFGGQGWQVDFLTARQESGISDDQKLIVSVGRVSQEKRLATVAAALEFLPDSHLAIVGGVLGEVGEKEAEKIREAASKAGAMNRITFIQPTRNPASWLAAANSFVVNSASEGYCLAAVEALAALVPLISTRVGVLADSEFDGFGEWIGSEATPREIATAVARVHRGGAEIQARRRGAARWVREHHSAVAMAGRWAEFLVRIAEKEREAPSRHLHRAEFCQSSR